MKEKTMYLPIPIQYLEEDGDHILWSDKETEKFLNIPIVVQEDSKEKAINEVWNTIRCHLDYLEQRSAELDKWKPFQKGNWKHVGGSWVTIFGINIYFRYGRHMLYGSYIPFTKLNITVTNYWRQKTK